MDKGIWIIKHRPKMLKDVVGQKHITRRLRTLVKRIKSDEASLPHLLLAGPTGTGKTTVAQALVRELYGDDYHMKELNASDDRGIDTVRNDIKQYCQTASFDGQLNIVFLDEADGLTDQAQKALCRTMERFSKNTRFILSCNYTNKIIDTIRGRCVLLNFTPLDMHEIAGLVSSIAKKENIEIDKDAATLIGVVCQGDARTALNALHYIAETQDHRVTSEDIYDHAWRIDLNELRKLLRLCIDVSDVDNEKSRLNQIDSVLFEFYKRGYTNQNIVDGMYLAVKEMKISTRMKAKMIAKIGDLDYRMAVGCNPTIQIRAFLFDLLYTRLKAKK